MALERGGACVGATGQSQGSRDAGAGLTARSVLGGRVDPLAQSKKRREGDQEPHHMPPSHQELLVLGVKSSVITESSGNISFIIKLALIPSRKI